jgi:hypothetical protein
MVKFEIPASQTVSQFAKSVIVGPPGAAGRDPESFQAIQNLPGSRLAPRSARDLVGMTNCGTVCSAEITYR